MVGQGLFCEGLSLLLFDEKDVEIIRAVGNCSEALEIATQERPEVILLDHLQIRSNQEAFNALLESLDSLKVISLTLSENKMVIHNHQQISDVTLSLLKQALRVQTPSHQGEKFGR
jgi:DNA-binding NarL/FixJ family response regulator